MAGTQVITKTDPQIIAVETEEAFSIPPELSTLLRLRTSPLDSRSDEEILASLLTPAPITSEKNIWAFWHSGLSHMPPWSRRNVTNWVRRLGPQWTVRILDTVDDSPLNVLKYVKPKYLPQAFLDGTMDGLHAGAHRSDLIRGPLLFEYGGIWIDVGIMIFRHVDRICWDVLADPESPFDVAVPHGGGVSMFNYFIAARKGSEFIRHFHEVFLELWKGKTSCDGVNQHPLLKPVFEMQARLKAEKADITMDTFDEPFAVPADRIMDYIAQMLCWERVCMIEKDPANDGFSGRECWESKTFLFEGWGETAPAGRMIGWKGQDLFDVLATPTAKIEGGEGGERYEKSKRVVWHMLANGAMQKVYRGSMLVNPSLGTLWDRSEGADGRVGTWAEVLRWGSVNLEQTREMERVVAPRVVMTIEKEVLEA